MCHLNLISIESREVPLGTGSGSGTGTEYKYCCYKRMFLLFLLFNTFFLIQELASVRMKRFLTSRTAEDRADAAELARERSIHPWRDMGAPTSRRHSLSTRANPLLASRRISLADVSAPISPGQAYARAATAAAGYATPSFQPTVTSTPIQAAAAAAQACYFLWIRISPASPPSRSATRTAVHERRRCVLACPRSNRT
jgi:hypothetical protein